VCEYLDQIHGNENNCARQGSFSSLMDAAITRAIQVVVLNGLRSREMRVKVSREILASTISWAVYGAAREWFYSAKRQLAEEVVPSLAKLILPLVSESSVAASNRAISPHSAKGRKRSAAKKP
jgi:hypothetical protein